MRIVGGRLRGRRLTAPAGNATRPTTDRVRESLFNILESRYRDRLVGGRVGDLFAGTGALGIEALSRGAAHATFIEQSPEAFRILKDNISTLGLENEATLIRGDAKQALRQADPFHILFLDPPYGGEVASDILEYITTYRCILPEGVVVLESGATDRLEIPKELHTEIDRRYGKTQILLLKAVSHDPTD